jgi:hypothetical protein
MNAAPEQLPLAPPEGLEVVNPHNIDVNKYYIVHFVQIEDGAVIPDEGRPWWDLVMITDASQDSIKYDRVKTFMTGVGPAGNDVMWYSLDLENDPGEMIDVVVPREALKESTEGLNDGQYFVFYAPAAAQAQAGGRRRRRRSTRRHRRASRRQPRASRRHRRA